MNKYEKLRAITLIVGISILIVVIVVGGMIVIPKEDSYNMPKCKDVILYKTKVGETLPKDELNVISRICNDNNTYYKVAGYTKNEEYLNIFVNVVKKDYNGWLTVDNNIIGSQQLQLDEAIDMASIYKYTFINNNDNYQLKSIELQYNTC